LAVEIASEALAGLVLYCERDTGRQSGHVNQNTFCEDRNRLISFVCTQCNQLSAVCVLKCWIVIMPVPAIQTCNVYSTNPAPKTVSCTQNAGVCLVVSCSCVHASDIICSRKSLAHRIPFAQPCTSLACDGNRGTHCNTSTLNSCTKLTPWSLLY
jgi:hypothetical protein